MDNLTKAFIHTAETPMPQSQGINFTDIYLDNEFNIATRSPNNNNYVRVPHAYRISSADFENRELNLQKHLEKIEKL